MQLITKFSKKFILVLLLSFTLLITQENKLVNNTTDLIGLDASTSENANSSTDSIWDDMSREFKLDHQTQTSQVQTEIHRLLADQNKFYQILNAAAPYIYYIHEQTQVRGLPAEIALIPFIESEYDPDDRSNKGALGLWQLMSGTAHELGVKIRSGYDGRRNIVASTKAALAYFKDLGNNFNGNWYLAIAAYNCGQEKVESAKRRAKSDSFWNLHLPRETKYYVPRLLAVAAIIKNHEKYGVQLPRVVDEPYFTELTINKPVTLNQLAKSSGINIKTLHTLNPDFKHATATKTKTVLVPLNKSQNKALLA
ncbi:MAG: transglycosylase SLT domain-containing protein [Gammaproteobacteria bacterium]|nr:transglycosylase SLT domain-containing protein [Gammaproteobacteria bacterium]